MSKKVVEKKVQITANFYGKTEIQKLNKAEGIAQAHKDQDIGVVPAPPDVLSEIAEARIIIDKRAAAELQVKSYTGLLNTAINKITDEITNKWCPQDETIVGKNLDQIKSLGLGAKGFFKDSSDPLVNVSESFPEIINIAQNHLQHTLEFLNNITKKFKLPKGAKRMDLFATIGGDEPKDIKKMTYLGSPVRGKYINTSFTADQVGLTVWYIVVYVAKKAGTTVIMTKAVSATVI